MKYFILIIKHKWFVMIAGFKTKAPLWNLLIHDWTKFTISELPHYQRQFFGSKDDPIGFMTAWLHHQNSNKHHWEYWIPRTGHNRCDPPYKNNEPMPMPEKYVREMVADWMAAGRAYEGKWPDMKNWDWFDKSKSQIIAHDKTWDLIYKVIQEVIDTYDQN